MKSVRRLAWPAMGGRWFGRLRGGLAAGCGHVMALVFPPRCACCAADLAAPQSHLPLCDDCRRQLAPARWDGCPRCGSPGGGAAAGGNACAVCASRELQFDGAVVLGGYEGLLREVILRLKRGSGDPLARVMGGLLLQSRGRELLELRPDVIVAVPMFWGRRLRRGVNNPTVLAGVLGRALRVPVRNRWLVRWRNTLPQANLTPRQRLANVRGAFRVGRRARLAGCRVLLVDDILTTGATCNEAARTLKRAGAAAVFAAVLGRAARGDSV